MLLLLVLDGTVLHVVTVWISHKVTWILRTTDQASLVSGFEVYCSGTVFRVWILMKWFF